MSQSSVYENHNPSPPHSILCAYMKKREKEGRERREEGGGEEMREQGRRGRWKEEGEGREGEGQGW